MILIYIGLGFLLFVMLIVGGAYAFFRHANKNKTRWGVNFDEMVCPDCNTKQPITRVPANRREMLWGGFTCRKCGTEADKWGRKIEKTH
jgi:ribosomal protein L40E